MTESFSELFNQSLENRRIRNGSVIDGTVVSIFKDMVLVDAGLKSESSIPIEQFIDSDGNLEVKVGDVVEVVLDMIEDGYGETILSREKAKKYIIWSKLKDIFEKSKRISGTINGRVKGGFTVELNGGIRAFLPGSLVDLYPIKENHYLEGKEFDFKVIKIDQKRNNVVVSRKAIVETENNAERIEILENMKEGSSIKGIVKNITDYGAFLDLRGIDGLLHITDMTWKRIKHPSEILNIGDEILVKILKLDKERNRVSLGLKQLSEDPWKNIKETYSNGKIVQGRVTNLTDYGCFVEIKDGIEGLVHISEMDWTKKNIHPSKIVTVNEIIKVMILNIDESKRRISLGIKQCQENPWKKFANIHKKGDKIKGKIKSITDFGIFVELNNNIDGLIHISDITWKDNVSEIINNYKKNDKIEAVLLQVDVERERVSLSIKHLSNDPFFDNLKNVKKGDIIDGIIKQINKNNIVVQLKENMEGICKIEQDSSKFILNSKLQFKIINIDYKNKIFILSFFEDNNISI